jgi:cation transport ATPase
MYPAHRAHMVRRAVSRGRARNGAVQLTWSAISVIVGRSGAAAASWLAEVLPEGKVTEVRRLQDEGE